MQNNTIMTLLQGAELFPFKNLAQSDLVCAFSPRHYKNMSLSDADTSEVLNNRQNFLSGLGINYKDLVCAKQVHGGGARLVTEKQVGSGALTHKTALDDTDALITHRKNLPLAIFTADCLPVFLYDSKTPAIGIVHAGWKSSKEDIIAKTIGLMREKFMTKPADLYLAFGPAIRNCCYEVEMDFGKHFSFGLSRRNGHYYFDLIEINKSQAMAMGVKEKNIFDSMLCTSCRLHDFFSYRREGLNSARMLSVIMLR